LCLNGEYYVITGCGCWVNAVIGCGLSAVSRHTRRRYVYAVLPSRVLQYDGVDSITMQINKGLLKSYKY
jgi:hypothetical protein